jgi:hypothetical protein
MVSQGVLSHLLRDVQMFKSRNCGSVAWASTIRRCNSAALRKSKNSRPSDSILSGGKNVSACAGSSTKTSSPGCLERAPGSSLFFAGKCSTSKLNCFNSMAHRVSFPLSSWTLSSQVRMALSVRSLPPMAYTF